MLTVVASQRPVRGFTITDKQAESLLARGILASLADYNTGQTPVRLRLTFDRLYIPDFGKGSVLGGNYPHAGGEVQMVDGRNGNPIGDGIPVYVGGGKAAGGQFRPGLIGTAMQPGEEKDFANVAAALGQEIGKKLLRPKK